VPCDSTDQYPGLEIPGGLSGLPDSLDDRSALQIAANAFAVKIAKRTTRVRRALCEPAKPLHAHRSGEIYAGVHGPCPLSYCAESIGTMSIAQFNDNGSYPKLGAGINHPLGGRAKASGTMIEVVTGPLFAVIFVAHAFAAFRMR